MESQILFCIFLFMIVVLFISVLININKKFKKSYFILFAPLFFGLLFISQKGNKKTFKMGPLIVTVEEENNQGKFEIRNPTNKNVKQNIGFATSDYVQNIVINKGNNFISVIDGGVDNNFVIYSAVIPPNQVASGTIVSLGPVSLIPQLQEKKK